MKPTVDFNTLSDCELISLYKQTLDLNIIGDLFKRYTRFVFLISHKYLQDEDESSDAVMQIFENLIDDLKNHEIENFKAWLHTVTRNHCLMKLRKNKSIQKKQERYFIESENFMESDDFLHHNEKHEHELKIVKVHEAISDLNEEQKICIELFYIESKSYNEIAEITGYSVKNIKSYIQNGKRNLKNNLIKSGISGFIILLILMS